MFLKRVKSPVSVSAIVGEMGGIVEVSFFVGGREGDLMRLQG